MVRRTHNVNMFATDTACRSMPACEAEEAVQAAFESIVCRTVGGASKANRAGRQSGRQGKQDRQGKLNFCGFTIGDDMFYWYVT